ncbi:MAG: protein kinase [Deltaproteobacteria bacterium]|nr:protein kinase [Deltaproteobacteria bacterium]
MGDTRATLETRSQIGPFRLEGVLGSGAMGVVYRGLRGDGQVAAVKVVRAHLRSDDLVRRFRREAEIRIEHPNVVRVLDAGADRDGTPYIAFELLEGESLADRLAHGRARLADVIDIGVQVCRGLEAVHAAGLIHRDLKPANLFSCRDGSIKLVDFGIALWTDADTRITSVGTVLGTASYLAPEQARGDGDLDARADLWALGVILYEMLTGRPPFDRGSVLPTIVAVLMEEAAPLPPGVPVMLREVVMRALSKEPALRWPDARAFADALAACDLGDAGDAPVRAQAALAATEVLPGRSITLGENRVVAILLAHDVHDREVIERAVKERGGLFLQLMGGRAVGLFGGESWEGDEVKRATSAALAAAGAAGRIAVASGRATRAGAAISGDVLRKAEESCAALPGGVAVDGATARSLFGDFALVPIAGARLFQVEAASDTGTGTGAGSGLGSDSHDAPDEALIGRRTEVAQLRAGIEAALVDGRASAVLLVGPPGIGKSRLRREADSIAAELGQSPTVLMARGEPARREAALALLSAAVLGRARANAAVPGAPRIDADAPLEERRTAVLTLAGEALPGAAALECGAFLGELLGVSMPGSLALQTARADPQLMADRLRLSVLEYLAGLCARGPVALVLEDLQWADQASLEVLDELLEREAESRLLLLATARPELIEARPQLFAGRSQVRVELRGLGAAEVATLAQRIARRPLPEPLLRAIAERTAGNPLFVEQIVLELRDQDRLDAVLDDLPLPLTVEAAVQSRLDHLPMVEKELCKRAAVLGRPFSVEEVEALGVLGAAKLLASLSRRELVSARGRTRAAHGREWQFKSSLVADVAYRMLADELRQELHRRTAAFLAAGADAGSGVDDEEIAIHHERGGEAQRAATRFAAAALGPKGQHDPTAVVRCAERALALGAPEHSMFALRMARAGALRFMLRLEDQGRELEAARAAARTPVELARVGTERAFLLARTGRPAEALAAANAAVAAAREGGDADVLALALGWRAVALIYGGKLADAQSSMAEIDGLGALATETRAMAAHWRAQLATARGDIGERLRALRASVALYEEVGDLRRAAGDGGNLADVYNRVGAYVEAENALREALVGLRRVGHKLTEAYTLVNLAYSLSMQGRAREALTTLDEAETLAAKVGDTRLAAFLQLYRARALLAHDPPLLDRAIVAAEAAAAEAIVAGLPAVRVGALTLGAAAHLVAGDHGAAMSSSSTAMATLVELGSLEEDEAEVYVVHARVLAANGLEDDAASTRQHGRERVSHLAGLITDPDLRTRFLADVPAHRELS